MDPMDDYFHKRLKNMGGMHRAPSNSKMRLLQAARHMNDSQEVVPEGKVFVNKHYFESNSTYNLFERAEEWAHLYSVQWGMTNLRLIL
jgi:hypothetical protein